MVRLFNIKLLTYIFQLVSVVNGVSMCLTGTVIDIYKNEDVWLVRNTLS